MVNELMGAFRANATEFGLLSAFFYFIYTPMQIIVGPLTDLYGARRILTLAIVTCAIGSYIFSISEILLVAAIGRSLIGFGSAFAFVCVLKLADSWLPQKFFGMFVGFATALGMIGAIFQVTLFSSMVGKIGWQQTINFGTIAGVLLIPLLWMIIRDHPENLVKNSGHRKKRPPYKETFLGFLKIIKHPQMWVNGMIAGIMYLSLSLFAELWGIPFLSNVYNLSPNSAAIACSMVYLGWLVGGPLIGYISDMTRSRKLPIVIGCTFSTIIILLIIYLPQINIIMLHILLFFFGLFSSAEVLCFVISSENNPKTLVATASAFTNFLTMLGGFAAQPLVGSILDIFWTGETINNIRVYSTISYQLSFTILPLALILGSILTFWLREPINKKFL